MMILALFLSTAALASSAELSFEPAPEALLKKARRHGLYAPIQATEEVRGLVDYPEHVIETIPAMELNKSHELYYSPWSGHTWPLAKGQIARRFSDGGFPNSDDWKSNHDYTHFSAPASELVRLNRIDLLSPAEKYDLLVDPTAGFKFTEANWEEGGKYFRDKGKVEPWMGICHGTTAAGVMERKPLHVVEAVSADGMHQIRFYPSDIKALASAFWAYVSYNAKFAGIRCNLKPEEMDSRRKFPECFDTNAGAFHLALVNQIGLFKKPFVIDRSNDHEVWNHTIFSYKFDWVNPKTRSREEKFKDALIPIQEWKDDKFKNYRSPLTKYVIGVHARAAHRVSERASTRRNASSSDPFSTEVYKYDLELDENLRVLGGEWYQSRYPDFLWRPSLTEAALAPSERGLSTVWDMKSPIPEDWKMAADMAFGWDGKTRIPLGRIVQMLVNASQSPEAPPSPEPDPTPSASPSPESSSSD